MPNVSKKPFHQFLILAASVLVCAINQAQNISLEFEVSDKTFKQLKRFEKDGRWGARAMEPGYRLIEVSTAGCQVRDSVPVDCEKLVSSLDWDATEVAVVKPENFTSALLKTWAAGKLAPKDPVQGEFTNILDTLTALDNKDVPFVWFGSNSTDTATGRVLATAYRDYTLRNHVINVYQASAACKTGVARFIQKHGYAPKEKDLANVYPANECDAGIVRTTILPDTGTIVVTFQQDQSSPDYLHDKAMWFTLDLERIFALGKFEYDCNSNMPVNYVGTRCLANQKFDNSVR